MDVLSPYGNLISDLKLFFIAFDVETTGLSPQEDEIIEIGAVAFRNGQPAEEFSTLINPGKPIPAAASSVNGITDAMVTDAPSLSDAIPRFKEFLKTFGREDILFVSHNAHFDRNFLAAALRKCHTRLGVRANFIDTLYYSREKALDVPNHKLATLSAYYGINNPMPHRSIGDAITCGQLLLALFEEKKRPVASKPASKPTNYTSSYRPTTNRPTTTPRKTRKSFAKYYFITMAVIVLIFAAMILL